MTDKPSTEEQLTLFAEDSPVRTSALPETRKVSPPKDQVYGANYTDLLARYDPDTQSSKMSQPLFLDQANMSNKLTDAYVAGLIDGEGCLYVNKGKTKKEMPTYTARIDIGMAKKAKAILEKLHKQYGGSLTMTRKATEKWDEVWRWVLTGEKAKMLCLELIPHLQLKKEQAILLSKLNPKDGEVIKQLISELNQKGPNTTIEAGYVARLVGGKWLTAQRDLVNSHGSEEFSETWPRSGMTQNGIAYRLPNLARTITEIGSGLFATPNTLDGLPPKSEKAIRREMEVTRKGRSQPANLRDQVTQKYWPAPRNCSAMSATLTEKTANHKFKNLEVQIAKTIFPTPCSRDHKGARSLESLEMAGRDGTNSLPDAFAISKKSARLNPQFVEVLMGFPIMHTDLKDSETP